MDAAQQCLESQNAAAQMLCKVLSLKCDTNQSTPFLSPVSLRIQFSWKKKNGFAVKDREAWHAEVRGIAKSRHDWATEQQTALKQGSESGTGRWTEMQKLGHLIQTTREHIHINMLSVTENAAGINSKAPREAQPGHLCKPAKQHTLVRVCALDTALLHSTA